MTDNSMVYGFFSTHFEISREINFYLRLFFQGWVKINFTDIHDILF